MLFSMYDSCPPHWPIESISSHRNWSVFKIKVHTEVNKKYHNGTACVKTKPILIPDSVTAYRTSSFLPFLSLLSPLKCTQFYVIHNKTIWNKFSHWWLSSTIEYCYNKALLKHCICNLSFCNLTCVLPSCICVNDTLSDALWIKDSALHLLT